MSKTNPMNGESMTPKRSTAGSQKSWKNSMACMRMSSMTNWKTGSTMNSMSAKKNYHSKTGSCRPRRHGQIDQKK